MKRWLIRVAIAIPALALLLAAGALGLRAYAQHRIAQASRITEPQGIASLETVRLGGRDQAILIRGHDRTKPVLLMLHGGPGGPLMPEARGFSELEKHFVVVQWDQRGAGKSWRGDISPKDMRIEQFESDAVELVNLLRARFGAQKIYLFGHSWGTILGARVAAHHPELLWAYIGAGQVVNPALNEKISYDYVVDQARKAGDQKDLAALARIKPPYETIAGLKVQRPLLWKYLSLNRPKDQPAPKQDGWLPVLTSPDYSLIDVWRAQHGLFWSLGVMWKELMTVDLVKQVSCIDAPVYLFEGRRDYQVPFELAVAWEAGLKAPRKEIVWFDQSGHDMYLDEPKRFQDVLIHKVLPETFGKTQPSVCAGQGR